MNNFNWHGGSDLDSYFDEYINTKFIKEYEAKTIEVYELLNNIRRSSKMKALQRDEVT